MTIRRPELSIIPFPSREAWEAWLEEHHAISDGQWLELAKKGSGLGTVSLAEALEVALCTVGSTARRTASTTSIGCSVSPRAGRGASGRRSTASRWAN
jgi:hypothetical protein